MSVRPTIGFTIDGGDFSNNVIKADWVREWMFTVGRFEVILDPGVSDWINFFDPRDDIIISVNGTTMMRGYLDDIHPFLDERGVYTDLYRLIGRDYGFDLVEFYISQGFANVRADDIVQNALITAQALGSELFYTSPNLAPTLNYDFDRTWLQDGLIDLAESVGYDGYVQNTKVLGQALVHFFQVGDVGEHQPVDLTLIANDPTNTVLHFDMGEKRGYGIKNYIEAIAGPLRDHYTDLNGADWNALTGAVSDELTLFLNGKGAIRLTNNTGGLSLIEMELDFTGVAPGLYGYTLHDLREPARGRFNYLVRDTQNLAKSVQLGLVDVNGTQIWFYRARSGGLLKCFNCTDQSDGYNPASPNPPPWRSVDFTLGEDSAIENVNRPADSKGHWYYQVPPGAVFDWSQVRRFRFRTTGKLINNGDFFIVDGLSLGNLEVHAIAEDAGVGSSQAIYGFRMLPIYRPDSANQLELQVYADWELQRHKDPAETLTVIALGQVNSLYAAMSLDVRIGNYIPALTVYRIRELHHSLVRSTEESERPGYTFLTEYDLVRQNLTTGSLPVQQVSPLRLDFAGDEVKGRLKRDRRSLRFQERRETLEI